MSLTVPVFRGLNTRHVSHDYFVLLGGHPKDHRVEKDVHNAGKQVENGDHVEQVPHRKSVRCVAHWCLARYKVGQDRHNEAADPGYAHGDTDHPDVDYALVEVWINDVQVSGEELE